MRPKISKDIMIGELVMNYPEAVEVLYSHGFHCIGCGLSAYETLGQGAAAHGYDEGTVDMIIREIQEAAKNADDAQESKAAQAAVSGKKQGKNRGTGKPAPK